MSLAGLVATGAFDMCGGWGQGIVDFTQTSRSDVHLLFTPLPTGDPPETLHPLDTKPTHRAQVKPPRVGESAVQLECQLVHSYPVVNSAGEQSTTIVIGKVLLVHVSEGVATRTPTGKVGAWGLWGCVLLGVVGRVLLARVLGGMAARAPTSSIEPSALNQIRPEPPTHPNPLRAPPLLAPPNKRHVQLMVDFEKLRPMGRLGGNTYGQVAAVFDLPRPDRSAG